MPSPRSDLERLSPYLADIHEGSITYAAHYDTIPEDVAFLCGICLRESLAGWAPGYRPIGSPDGTGDWTARTGAWLRGPGVQVVRTLPPGWTAPRKSGQVVPGPYAIPYDGLGWGRGIFQIDVLGDVADLVAPAPWPVDRQAYAACAMLDRARRELVEFIGHPLYLRAVAARYNAAIHRVRAGMDAGDPDIGTTHGNFGADVLRRRDLLREQHPEVFPPPRSRAIA